MASGGTSIGDGPNFHGPTYQNTYRDVMSASYRKKAASAFGLAFTAHKESHHNLAICLGNFPPVFARSPFTSSTPVLGSSIETSALAHWQRNL